MVKVLLKQDWYRHGKLYREGAEIEIPMSEAKACDHLCKTPEAMLQQKQEVKERKQKQQDEVEAFLQRARHIGEQRRRGEYLRAQVAEEQLQKQMQLAKEAKQKASMK